MRPLSLALVVVAPWTLACAGAGGGGATDTAAANDEDVRGVYDVAWADTWRVRLDIGGAVQDAESDEGVVTFEGPDGSPLALDLAAWCADPAVACPTEAWPAAVAIDEDDPSIVRDAHTLRAWDAVAPGAVVTGLVDHTADTFLFGLDAGSGSTGDCGALALSLAGGTFVYDGYDTGDLDSGGIAAPGGPVGIADGEVALGWLGLCVWSDLAVAATVTIETDFTALRAGPLPE
jgi:hypothetical protein